MTNPSCIKCISKQNSPNDCICNNERRCAKCQNCEWCINRFQDGRCVPSEDYTKSNCPYSFASISDEIKNQEQEFNKNDVEVHTDEPIIFNLSIYKIAFIIATLLLIIILLLAYIH
jgi:hypothetical protein